MVEFYKGLVSLTGEIVYNMPANMTAFVQTDEEVTIAFWNRQKKDFGDPETLPSPGGPVNCPDRKARITATGADSNVVVHAGR